MPQAEENRLPVRYQGTETPLIFVEAMYYFAGPTHATSATLQLSISTPATGLVHCFPLTLALTAQHRHSAVSPHSAHGSLDGIWFLFPLILFFSGNGFYCLFIFSLFLDQPDPMLDFTLNTERMFLHVALTWATPNNPLVDYFFYPYYLCIIISCWKTDGFRVRQERSF